MALVDGNFQLSVIRRSGSKNEPSDRKEAETEVQSWAFVRDGTQESIFWKIRSETFFSVLRRPPVGP